MSEGEHRDDGEKVEHQWRGYVDKQFIVTTTKGAYVQQWTQWERYYWQDTICQYNSRRSRLQSNVRQVTQWDMFTSWQITRHSCPCEKARTVDRERRNRVVCTTQWRRRVRGGPPDGRPHGVAGRGPTRSLSWTININPRNRRCFVNY